MLLELAELATGKEISKHVVSRGYAYGNESDVVTKTKTENCAQ
jgi:tetraacyldisaccharide-1-P 4'-kinase